MSSMDMDLIKILINTALFGQVWMIQMVLFPSFLHFTEDNWKAWQRILAMRITIVMVPLMLAQLITYIFSLVSGVSAADVLSTALMLVAIGVTFYIGIYWHDKCQAAEDSMELRKLAIKVIWIRTLAWTLMWIISLSQLIG